MGQRPRDRRGMDGVLMRYWLDTEFIEDGKTIDLISLGIVAEDGRELYIERDECRLGRANKWVQKHVLPHLGLGNFERFRRGNPNTLMLRLSDSAARSVILGFCDPKKYGEPEFWGYYCDYDWVAVCQLFGSMADLPTGWPMYCRDIKQWADDLGNPRLPEQGKDEHHALADARWNKAAWEFLRRRARSQERTRVHLGRWIPWRRR